MMVTDVESGSGRESRRSARPVRALVGSSSTSDYFTLHAHMTMMRRRRSGRLMTEGSGPPDPGRLLSAAGSPYLPACLMAEAASSPCCARLARLPRPRLLSSSSTPLDPLPRALSHSHSHSFFLPPPCLPSSSLPHSTFPPPLSDHTIGD
jgi:hypothetical protein